MTLYNDAIAYNAAITYNGNSYSPAPTSRTFLAYPPPRSPQTAIKQTPEEYLDWSVNWVGRLGSDTITGSIWAASPTLAVTDGGFDDTTTTIWITGGTAGQYYTIINTITTTDGRTMQEYIPYWCLAERFI